MRKTSQLSSAGSQKCSSGCLGSCKRTMDSSVSWIVGSCFSSTPSCNRRQARFLPLLSADEQHANLLTPTFALSATLPMSTPSYENMSSSELEAFLAEMDVDIRAADRDLREIDILEKKDVTAAGKLPEHATLQPRLDALMKANEEDLLKAAELEERIASIMDRYATNVCSSSHVAVCG